MTELVKDSFCKVKPQLETNLCGVNNRTSGIFPPATSSFLKKVEKCPLLHSLRTKISTKTSDQNFAAPSYLINLALTRAPSGNT